MVQQCWFGPALFFGLVRLLGAGSRAAQAAGKRLKVHLKADTGMSRLGFLCDETHLSRAAEEMARAAVLPGLEAEGIFTHFADADGDEAYTMRQFTRFLDLLGAIFRCFYT